MFNRRRTRNLVAYTGVGYLASGHQPDNIATAAALTIGKKLPPGTQKPPAIGSLGLLLKRLPSLQSNSIRSTSTPNHARTGSVNSDRHSFSKVEYSVDDSFTDSQIEDMGRDADAHYSNRAQLRDLKLTHLPPQPAVKMVKKYVPTPNGIKVVEVPETSMKQAIARSNSMRLGLALGRNGSLSSRTGSMSSRTNSLSRAPRTGSLTNQKRVTSKRSTLADFKIEEGSELDTTKQRQAAAELQRQIEDEREVAAKLEAQRKEYEQLKQLRAQNEKHRAELERLREEEESFSRQTSRQTSPRPEESVPTSIANSFDAPQPVKPQPPTLNALPDDAPQALSTDDEEVPIEPVPFAVDEFEQKNLGRDPTKLPATVDEPEDVTSTYSLDDTSVTHAFTAEEVDENDVIQNYTVSADPQEDEFGIVEVPDEDHSPSLAQQVKSTLGSNNTNEVNGKESILLPGSSNASVSESTTPKFVPHPEVINDDPYVDHLAQPPAPGLASSIKSGSSNDSRPIKSAMKNSRSTYGLNNNAHVSPAQQAYLSLTTAENTRLNSKLSSSQLVDSDSLSAQHIHPGPSRSPVSSQKFAATSLRKNQVPPPQPQHAGLADRSLRPRAPSDASNRQSLGGMSSRTFKSNLPQAIPPHPYSDPHYQSPAKAKAAELFARANNRPASTAQPLKRESSFNKGSEGTRPETSTPHQPPLRNGKHRFTLRPDAGVGQQENFTSAAASNAHSNIQQQAQQQAQQQLQQQNQQAQQQAQQLAQQQQQKQQRSERRGSGGFKIFKSRIADSDEEDSVPPASTGGGFRSRFRDLEDHGQNGGQAQSPVHATLRQPKADPVADEAKPKKKKKFLKKLFGRN